MRVLLAEDDALLASRLQTLLEEAGYVVIHSAEGRDAEYQGQIEDIAAAVVDLGLPGLDGLSVIERCAAVVVGSGGGIRCWLGRLVRHLVVRHRRLFP